MSKEIEPLWETVRRLWAFWKRRGVAEILRKKHADETRVYGVRRLFRQDSHAAKLKITHPAKQ